MPSFMQLGEQRLAGGFRALSKAEQAAVAAYVKQEYDRLVFQHPNSYLSRNAQSDPETWQNMLRELVARDAERVATIVDVYLRNLDGDQSGFTLIELSIVLVIIGLIVGGVLVGQDLIRAAAERAQITQIEKFNTAVNTFFGKYGALPGDLSQQVASAFGFASRGQYAGEGDGNGKIQGVNGNGPGANFGFAQGAGETVMFWSDLTYANGVNVNLIEGSFSAASPSTLPGASVTGNALSQWLPSAKLGNGNYVYVFGDGYNNYFALSAVSSISSVTSGCQWCIVSTPGITVKQAYDIDKKVDDGLPQTGRVLAFYLDANTFGAGGNGFAPNAVNASSTTCFDTTSGSYSVTVSGGNNATCALTFRMQGGD